MYFIKFGWSQTGAGKKKGKGGRNKKASKNKNNQRKNIKKTNMPHGGSDLAQKLYTTMEKHKEVYKYIIMENKIDNNSVWNRGKYVFRPFFFFKKWFCDKTVRKLAFGFLFVCVFLFWVVFF